MKIGKYQLENNLILPPIAGFSDIGLRKLCIKYGASLTVTEMVSAKGLIYGSENTASLLATHDSEKIKCVQLFGREWDIIAKAIRHELILPFDIIDINMGCPVPKIVKNGEGSALMTQPTTVHKIVQEAVKSADGRAVTVKIRAGFTKDNKNAVEIAKAIEDGGASAITVHGRTRDMYYSGYADWDIIKAVKDHCHIPVIGNGDIVDKQTMEEKMVMSGVDGVAIGRGAIGKPYVFEEVRGIVRDYDIFAIIREHISELAEHLPEKVVVNNMKKHIAAYLKGIKDGKRIKLEIYKAKTINELFALCSGKI